MTGESIRVGAGTAAADLDRREEIIEVAAELFRARGYPGTSMQEVADGVGILKGSLYHHIASKAELLVAITESFAEKVIPTLELAKRGVETPEASLREVILSHVDLVANNATKAMVFFRDGRFLEGEGRRWIHQLATDYERAFVDLIVAGQQSGTFRSDLDPMIVGRGMLGMLNSIYVWKRPEDGIEPSSVAADYADLLLAGLAPPAGGE